MWGGALLCAFWLAWAPAQATEPLPAQTFLDLVSEEKAKRAEAYKAVKKGWDARYLTPLLEVLPLQPDKKLGVRLIQDIEASTGRAHGDDLELWWAYVWGLKENVPPDYADFKRRLYQLQDPVFFKYFDIDRPASVRLDEIRWRGVGQDEIVPLLGAKLLRADAATYLADSDIVFGVHIRGEARAYPERVLAWHELFTDVVGGVPITGVYCTLTGSMIAYESIGLQFGASGFVYRSNKMLYDQGTLSLWSSMRGEAVMGPMVGRGIKLARQPVVRTTWGEWRRRNLKTLVLSNVTGHTHDYREGAATRDYFADDALRFGVPRLDGRLGRNKAEVLALRFGDDFDDVLAVPTSFLSSQAVWQDELSGQSFVVLTDPTGASRVYEDGGFTFTTFDGDRTAESSDGKQWAVTEQALTAIGGHRLKRLPAHGAFWFGWVAAFDNTRLAGFDG